jgi:apolipoprotein N-acyltransferase
MISVLAAVVLAGFCGAALVLSLAPFDFWPLAFVGAAGLFFLLARSPDKAGWIAVGFGLTKYIFGLSWVYVSIHVYGYASPWLAGSLVVLMAAIMTTVTWAQCVLYVRMRVAAVPLNLLLFAALWTLVEWMWTWWLGGFPWLFAGYSQLDSPLSGFAPVGGVFLVSFVVALIGASLASLFTLQGPGLKKFLPALTGVPLILIGWLLDPMEWTKAAGTQTVALVQGNTEQSVKWSAQARDAIVRAHVRLTAPLWGEVDTIIWPEGAITYWAHEADFLLERLDREGLKSATALVSGIPVAEREGEEVRVYNGVLAVGEGQGRYLKQILVPFGEYVPFESLLRGLIAFFDLPMSSFTAGPASQPLLTLKGVPAVMLICYEVAFPAHVARETRAAEVLLTISNDTWFGESIGPLQHMQIAQMRAREMGRWVLRATNNGLTGIIDSRGGIVATIPRFEEGVLRGTWERRQGTTPFQVLGNLPVLILLLLIFSTVIWIRHRQGASSRGSE